MEENQHMEENKPLRLATQTLYLLKKLNGFADTNQIARAMNRNNVAMYQTLMHLKRRGLILKGEKKIKPGGLHYPLIWSLNPTQMYRVDKLIREAYGQDNEHPYSS